jgi:hypothetical protein
MTPLLLVRSPLVRSPLVRSLLVRSPLVRSLLVRSLLVHLDSRGIFPCAEKDSGGAHPFHCMIPMSSKKLVSRHKDVPQVTFSHVRGVMSITILL